MYVFGSCHIALSVTALPCQLSHRERLYLRNENFRGESTVLGVAAEVAVQAFNDGIDPHQAKAVAIALGGLEHLSYLLQLLGSGEVCERNVQLRTLHIHVHTDHALVLRQFLAGFDGIVKEIADDAAQVQLGHFQLYGDMGITLDGDTLGLR